MISLALKLFEVIGDIRDSFVEEADNMYFSREKLKKTLKYGAIGLVASVGFAAAVWIYQSNKSRRNTAA